MVGAAFLPSAAVLRAHSPPVVGPSVRLGSASSSLFAPVITSVGRIAARRRPVVRRNPRPAPSLAVRRR